MLRGCGFAQRAHVCSKLIIIVMIFILSFFFSSFLFCFYVRLCLLLSIFRHHPRCSHHSIHVEIIINTCSWLRQNCECAEWNVVGNLWYVLFEFYLFRGRSSRIAIPGNNFRSRFNLIFFVLKKLLAMIMPAISKGILSGFSLLQNAIARYSSFVIKWTTRTWVCTQSHAHKEQMAIAMTLFLYLK